MKNDNAKLSTMRKLNHHVARSARNIDGETLVKRGMCVEDGPISLFQP